MKKMTFEEFYGMGWKNRWQAFNTLQTELETRGHGMGVDLRNAPREADSYCVVFGVMDEGWDDVRSTYDEKWFIGPISIPLQPKVERRKTLIQLSNEYVMKKAVDGDFYSAFVILQDELNAGNSIDDLCTAAGISLTVLEEV